MDVPHPLLYEINTRCWLRELSEKHQRPIGLGDVPDSAFEEWRRLGFTHVWAMGVWISGPRARAVALSHPDQRRVYNETLPGWTDADIGPSPYAIAEYETPQELGGEAGLRQFRTKLHSYGLKLILDFVPNHLGLDHPWLDQHPEYFVQSTTQVADTFPRETTEGVRWFAHGRDPNMPAWTDTVQVDFRAPAARAAMTHELQSVAARCDGVRCDMAMLVLNDVFARTWRNFPAAISSVANEREEFWQSAIADVKKSFPDFLFLAEVYWNLESRLQSLGFDFTYDKTLYDRLVARDRTGVQKHLFGMGTEMVTKCAHFLENHDESRIASILSYAEHRAAALLILSLPGMRFLHEGQLIGARVRVPVQMLRRPKEPVDPEVRKIYEQILAVLPQTAVGRGTSELLESEDLILIQWQSRGPAFDLITVNPGSRCSQGLAPMKLPSDPPRQWRINDLLGNDLRIVSHSDLQHGLPLDLPSYGAQLLHFEQDEP
jgi:hypothetical protein